MELGEGHCRKCKGALIVSLDEPGTFLYEKGKPWDPNIVPSEEETPMFTFCDCGEKIFLKRVPKSQIDKITST